ncbi:MAG: hypothetical protein JWM63_3102 [Gammaproteobacteria bacterium]|jgi:hypothetical protein|nr:hypothetical protein [Gammaproteobacteria bacterium]
MFITRKHLSRRTVLRGVGAAVALPLLDAMIPAATALAATAAAPKPKLGFIYFPHGAVMDRWQPAAAGQAFEFPQILAPLEPYKSHTTVVSGLRNKGAESPDPHGIIPGTWLSCVGPKNRETTGERGVTADQLAALHMGQDTPLPSLELSGESSGGVACAPGVGCGFADTVAFRTPTQPLPMEHNPRKVFYQLFGQGDTQEERVEIAKETGSILDSVMEKAKRLSADLGPGDKAMLADYLDSVREIERRVAKLNEAAATHIQLPDAPLGVQEDFGEQLKVMFELMALAWQADKTRVVSFMMAKEVSMRTYNQIGISDAFHPLSHHQNDPSKLDRLAKIQTYHTTIFAAFLKRLTQTPDGAGSLLDHAVILYGSNMSNSDKHNNDPLPSALLGRACGRVKGGQHLHYPQDTPHANLLLTVLNRAGIPLPSLGNSTGLLADI